jgi:DNA-binding GntR family transcriptional regulator
MAVSDLNEPRRLVDDLAVRIKKRILDGTYRPGERLRQEAVANEFAVSRTPLREALRMLEQEGLIILRPGRGAEVVSGDLDTLIDAYRVREVLDGLAARTVARGHASAEAFGHLQDTIERQKRTLDPWQPEKYAPLNVEFHGTILELSQNEYLTRQTSVLHMTANVFVPYRILDVDRVHRAIEEHQRILDALRSADAAAAEEAARSHIAATIRMLVEDRRRSIAAPPTARPVTADR